MTAQGKTGVLLINLGTPDSPSTSDVRKYLNEFFSDPRVIDIPRLKRALLKYLIILPFRSPKSARLYREIWTENGSPLLVHGVAVKESLKEVLGNAYVVELGMGYGHPRIRDAVNRLTQNSLKKLIVIPMFPQYASSTTGSVTAAMIHEIAKQEVIPSLETINCFYDHPLFLESWVDRISGYDLDSYDQILFSYHGLPERHIRKADQCGHCFTENCCENITSDNGNCYRAQCYETTRLLVKRLGLASSRYQTGFQSRFGKSPWIGPFLDHLIEGAAKNGAKRLLVIPPSFVADCLETLHEIAIEYNELFRKKGGEKLEMVESLNSHPRWVATLKTIVEDHS